MRVVQALIQQSGCCVINHNHARRVHNRRPICCQHSIDTNRREQLHTV